MAHPEAPEAVGAPVDLDSVTAALGESLDADDGIVSNETEASGEGEIDPLDLEAEGEGEAEGEPAAPAIAAPVSLTAEEKARYAQLPEEAQQFVAELETRRNAQVQTATTKASEAQRIAEANAATADAQARQRYAAQLKAFTDANAPQPPDPAIAEVDPGQYIALDARYKAERAQYDQFVQQVQAFEQQASTDIDQAFVAQRDRELMALPEVQNEATREEFFKKAIDVATTLGLQSDALNGATAAEWQKLRQIHDWKDKAGKFDAAMSRKMQRVRQGGTKTMKPNAAQPAGSANGHALVKQFEAKPSRDTAAALVEAALG
jgi:hypothetical protein